MRHTLQQCAALVSLAIALPLHSQVQAPLVSIADLPLVEVKATGESRLFAVLLTGDGNFAALDKGVAAELTDRGIPVVAFNQRSYLWSAKSPEQAGADLGRIMAWYSAKWHRDSVVIVGYSRGAGTAPFAVNRLPAALRGMVKAVALVGPENTALLHFRMRDLVSSALTPEDLPLMPELKKLEGTPMICFYGADEKNTPCPELAPPVVIVRLVGGHYFANEYQMIGRRIALFALGEDKR
jgi:type IV secretory pathway VirJ component